VAVVVAVVVVAVAGAVAVAVDRSPRFQSLRPSHWSLHRGCSLRWWGGAVGTGLHGKPSYA